MADESKLEIWVCRHTGASGRVYTELFETAAAKDAYMQVVAIECNPTAERYVPAQPVKVEVVGEVTRAHRLTVALAWTGGDEGELCIWERRFVEGEPQRAHGTVETVASLERLAVLLATAEARGRASVAGDSAGWIRCDKQMPVPFMDLPAGEEDWSLVMAPSRGVDMAAWDGERWVWRHSGYAIPSEVTHWMPLPAPPSAELTTAEGA
jgi:hypothetical protein